MAALRSLDDRASCAETNKRRVSGSGSKVPKMMEPVFWEKARCFGYFGGLGGTCTSPNKNWAHQAA